MFFIAFFFALWPMAKQGLVYDSIANDGSYDEKTSYSELVLNTLEILFVGMLGEVWGATLSFGIC